MDDPRGLDIGLLAGVRYERSKFQLGAEVSYGNSLGANDNFDLTGTGDLDVGATHSASVTAGVLSNEGITVMLRSGYQWTMIEDEDDTDKPQNTFTGPLLAAGLEVAPPGQSRVRIELVRTFFEKETLSGTRTDLDQVALRVGYFLTF